VRRVTLAVAILVLIAAVWRVLTPWSDYDLGERQPPLALAKVFIESRDQEKFVAVLKNFSESNAFHFARADPRPGFLNIDLLRKDGVSISIISQERPNWHTMAIYYRKPIEWETEWSRLIAIVKTKIGEATVVDIENPAKNKAPDFAPR
jgi:hypothetical protein